MKCPYCGNLGDKVVDSRESKEGDVIRRRRQCLNCHKRFTSRERIEDIEYRVVKKDGNREAFQRQKLIAGLLTASEKRPVSIQQLEAIADRIEAELQERPEREMTTEEIGARLMQELKQLDQIAYVRFASVYRQFRDVGQFKREVDELQKSKDELQKSKG
jgi:transcriptional repressor NrdR